MARLPWPEDAPVALVAQTTRSPGEVDAVASALRARYPFAETGDGAGTCTAVRDRQNAVREFAESEISRGFAPGVLVLGDASSSNTKRLEETARKAGAKAWRAASAAEAAAFDFAGVEILGVTSGASTPERLFIETVSLLRRKYGVAD